MRGEEGCGMGWGGGDRVGEVEIVFRLCLRDKIQQGGWSSLLHSIIPASFLPPFVYVCGELWEGCKFL